ncbi:MFS transporter [Arachnia propionica]|uniref:MFS transporter n=1 Tax=Arachnia propionica TaxID=1750 RepID=A0A3P1T8J2_9ACTN|nr:MFS transporter [Arachnia propionica]
MRRMFADTRPLSNPDFRRLWIASIITVIGAQITAVTVPAQIYAITRSSGMVGLTGLFGLVPLVVFGLWGGALADHMDRRRLMQITTTGLIVTSVLFWVQAVLQLNQVWLLLALFSVQQAFFAVNSPVRNAITARLLPKDQLAAASALGMTVFSGGAIAGPLLGGALIPVLGYAWLYLLDAVTMCATWYAVLRLPRLPVEGATGTPGLRSVIDGLAHLARHGVLLMSFVVDLIAMILGLPRALFPEIAHVTFGGPGDGGMELALLYTAIPAGMLLGGVFGGWVSRIRRQGLAVLWSITAWGTAITLLGLAVALAPVALHPMFVIALAMLAVGGVADMVSAAFRQAILLGAATDDVRGRLQGVFTVVVAGGPRIADILHGGAAELFGLGWAIGGGGLLVLLGVAVCALLSPGFRRYTT